uniref:Glycosyl transferase family 25 domain-containing protein n=1 Tax=viral metagenome TaxID=1070528 RepID=A0A6C0D3D2_9ZZZZ
MKGSGNDMTVKNKTIKNKNKITDNNNIDIIYWINMDKSRTRRIHMKKLLKNDIFRHIEKKRIKAVDGSKPNIETELSSIFENMDLCKYNLKEYAGLLSHLNTLIEFSNSNNNIALIFEDDVSLEYKKYWTESIQQVIQNAPKNWDVLQLSININKNSVLAKYVKKPLYVKGCAACAAAYIINKQGVLRFLHKVRKNGKFILHKNTEHYADIYMFENMNTYVYRYPMFTYIIKDSTQHPDHLVSHAQSKQIVDELVKKHYDDTINS